MARTRNPLFRATADQRLPERVRAVLAAREAESERLIAWAQLGLGLVWAALYLLAPTPHGRVGMIQPVPIALGAYLAFSAVRLAVVYRGRPPVWFLFAGVVLDIALLYGLVWSIHMQYGQPAAFYLKAPTMLYAFIFIALRSLRFSVGYVVAAGLSAAIGWLVLVALAVAEAGPGGGVTRDYVQYLTSNAILLGAEFDKVIALLLVTTVLAVGIHRGRQLLRQAVVDETANRELSRFFAPEVAAHITAAETSIQPGEGELRDAAILSIDVRDFTGLAMRTPPNELMALLADYQARMVEVIRRHGGVVDKFLGDGIMASFGAARPADTPAADALGAVDDVLAAAEAWAVARADAGLEPLRIGAAVASGPVVFGAVGDARRLEITVIGDAVNLAAKLEKANKREGVRALTTLATYRLAQAQGYRPAVPHEVRAGRSVEGTDRPVDLVVLG